MPLVYLASTILIIIFVKYSINKQRKTSADMRHRSHFIPFDWYRLQVKLFPTHPLMCRKSYSPAQDNTTKITNEAISYANTKMIPFTWPFTNSSSHIGCWDVFLTLLLRVLPPHTAKIKPLTEQTLGIYISLFMGSTCFQDSDYPRSKNS